MPLGKCSFDSKILQQDILSPTPAITKHIESPALIFDLYLRWV
jgi:hypothetical protein